MIKRLFGKMFKKDKDEAVPETVPKQMPREVPKEMPIEPPKEMPPEPPKEMPSKKDLEISFATTTPDLVEMEPKGEVDVFIEGQKVDTYYLATNPAIIGRDPSQSNIIISELIVSKKHCTIHWENDTVTLRDNNSTNGVYVDNLRVKERELKDGDVIMLGKKGTVKLVFKKRSGGRR
jgi:pSer/pThr/pTyr-binding forkhead associated (FHA) protein